MAEDSGVILEALRRMILKMEEMRGALKASEAYMAATATKSSEPFPLQRVRAALLDLPPITPESALKTYYIIRGEVSDPDVYEGQAFKGQTEYQFSDSPDTRSFSHDFLTLEKGLQQLSPAIFIWTE